jgi:N-acetylneuraminic acid mutarotase
MKKYLFNYYSLILIIMLSTIQKGQTQWTQISSIYNGAFANDGAVSFSINNYGYIVSGSSTANFYRYDSLANSWTLLGVIPSNMGHAFAMSFVVDNKAYVIGGDTGGVPLNTVWEFDPSTPGNVWVQKNNFPGGIRDAGLAFTVENYGYVGCGFNGTAVFNDIWKYDHIHDSWSLTSINLPINGLIFPNSFVIGSKAYILTGGTPPNGVNETKRMWCFDSSDSSLVEKNAFPGTARQAAVSFSINSVGFTGGGMSGYTTNYNDMWMFDPVADSWSPSVNLPLLGAAWSSSFVIGNTAFVGLGAKFVTGGLNGNDVFYKFSLSTTTDITSVTNSNDKFIISPNPAGSNFKISDLTQKFYVSIYSIKGELIRRFYSDGDTEISISDLITGIYSIAIEDGKQSVRRILVKQ